MNLFGKIKSYDLSKGEVTLKLTFLNESVLEELQTLLENNKFTKIQIRGSKPPKDKLSDSIRRKWYGVLSCILKWQQINITPEIMLAFHREMKESLFEIKQVIIDGRVIPLIPSITEIDNGKVNEACEYLIAQYSPLGCVFDFGE